MSVRAGVQNHMQPWRVFLVLLMLTLCACGPQIGSLERGEEGRVVRAFGGDTLELDNGLRVFLAEVDAPRGDAAYAAQAQGELEAMTLHREVLLAYGGTKRWTRRSAAPETAEEGRLEAGGAAAAAASAPGETAIAHVFVKSEGGRWFWLQHELVARGAAYVRPRRDNHARTAELLEIEAAARAGERGMWGRREYKPLNVRTAARMATEADVSCLRGAAPYRVVEGRVREARAFERRASLAMESVADAPFALVVFGDNFTAWDGPQLNALTGAHVRARGTLGVFHGEPQLCLEHSSQLEVLGEE
jgi:endonuclease YncB( thermonuclease family)